MLRPPLGVNFLVVFKMPRFDPRRGRALLQHPVGPLHRPVGPLHRLVPSAEGLMPAANATAAAARPRPRDRRPSLRDYRHPDTKKPGPQARRISGHRDAASRSPADYLTIKTPFIPTAKCAGKEQT